MRNLFSFALCMLFICGMALELSAQGPVFSNDESGRKAYDWWQERKNHPNSFQFFGQPRWNATVTNGGGLQQGDATTLTWSVIPDGTFIRSGVGEAAGASDLIDFLDGVYHGGASPGGNDLTQRTWWQEIDQTFDRFSDLSGLSYIYEANDDGANQIDTPGSSNVRGDVRIGGKVFTGIPGGVLAYNFGPDSGDMVIDTGDGFFNGNSLRFRNVVAHEHGHGVGQAHTDPVNNTKLLEPFINLNFDGPQFDDILGLQRQYGDIYEKNGGNDVFGNATSLGAVADGATVEIGADAIGLTGSLLNDDTDTDFISIDDNSDTDFLSFSVNSAANVDLTLTPVGPTYQEGPQNGATSPLNTAQLSDLTLTLFDTDGTTVLATSNVAGLGGVESISELLGSAGTYFARVTGANNNIQTYHLSVSAAFVVVPEPTGFGLCAVALTGLVFRRRRRK